MSEILQLPGGRIVDNRGIPKGSPCFTKYVTCGADATIGDAEVLLQNCQREARDAGVVWFRVTQVLLGNFKVEGWDHKPEGA